MIYFDRQKKWNSCGESGEVEGGQAGRFQKIIISHNFYHMPNIQNNNLPHMEMAPSLSFIVFTMILSSILSVDKGASSHRITIFGKTDMEIYSHLILILKSSTIKM